MMYGGAMNGLDAVGRNPQAEMLNNEMSRFAEFVRTFQGNPQQLLMQVMQSGQISQADLNQFQQIRNALAPMMGMMGRR